MYFAKKIDWVSLEDCIYGPRLREQDKHEAMVHIYKRKGILMPSS